MAKKSIKGLRDVPTPKIIRNYDIFSIEQRVHNLEQNAGGGGTDTAWDYSTTETDTKQKWVDGKEIYCIVKNGLHFSIGDWEDTGIDATNIAQIVDARTLVDIVGIADSPSLCHCMYSIQDNKVKVAKGDQFTGYVNTIILYYTKD